MEYIIGGFVLAIIGGFLVGFALRKHDNKKWKIRAIDSEKRLLEYLRGEDFRKPPLLSGIQPFWEYPKSYKEAFIPSGEVAPKEHYLAPVWSNNQIHDWQQLLNRPFLRGDLHGSADCTRCGGQGYIMRDTPQPNDSEDILIRSARGYSRKPGHYRAERCYMCNQPTPKEKID